MSTDDDLLQLAKEEEKLKELWRKILSYIQRDIAYVYTDNVREIMHEVQEEIKKIEEILKIFLYRVYTQDKKRFEIEMSHLELLLRYIGQLDKTKPNDFIRHFHEELVQVISDLETEKAEGRNAYFWERRNLLREWGFQLGVYINLERRLVNEWDTTLKIKKAAEPNFVWAIFVIGLPRCRDLVEKEGMLKVGMNLIKIAEKSKLGKNAADLFNYGLPKDEEVIKIRNLLGYGLNLIKRINILYPTFLDGETSMDEFKFRDVIKLAQATESLQKAKLYVSLSAQWNEKFLEGVMDG